MKTVPYKEFVKSISRNHKCKCLLMGNKIIGKRYPPTITIRICDPRKTRVNHGSISEGSFKR